VNLWKSFFALVKMGVWIYVAGVGSGVLLVTNL
jgi:hypothetical protein